MVIFTASPLGAAAWVVSPAASVLPPAAAVVSPPPPPEQAVSTIARVSVNAVTAENFFFIL